jgi:hypothetical protein
MSGALIRTVAAVIADGDGRVLLVRKRGSKRSSNPVANAKPAKTR